MVREGAPPFDLGEVVAGRYRVVAIAGAGGMGAVYRAVDEASGKTCALKVIGDGAARRKNRRHVIALRFSREARALRSIVHPAVVDYVDDGVTDSGLPYLVMEWVDGATLRDRMRAAGPTLGETLAVLHRLASALRAIHAVGIVHRDIKPRNLMLPGEGWDDIRIVDFGIARFADLAQGVTAGLTVTGLRLGTPGYMAPEQIVQAKDVDGRADVFSLGCVAFELLTGERAFPGKDGIALLARMVLEDAPSVRKARPELPASLGDLVDAMLARDPAKRPRADAALEEELAAIAAIASDLGPATPREERRAACSDGDDAPEGAPLSGSTTSPVATPAEVDDATVISPRAPLAGRAADLDALKSALRPGRIVGLWGAVGVGKSRLVAELALTHSLPTMYVDARTARDASSILQKVATRLNVSRVDAAHVEIIRALRARSPALLVLDGVEEDAPDAAAMLTAWTEGAPQLAVVVTSRRLPSFADRTIELGPLSTRRERGELSPAAAMLADRARDAGAALGPDDAAALEALAARLEGHPLSLELAAARLARTDPGALLEELARPLEALGYARADEYPDTLEGALASAWDALDDRGKDALARIVHFEGDFAIEDATAVLGGGPAALDRLQGLRERSLCSPGVIDGTLAIGSAIRDFVARRAEAIAPGGAEAHAAYVANLGEALARELERSENAAARARLSMRVADLTRVVSRDDLLAARAALGLDAALAGRVFAAAHHEVLSKALVSAEAALGTSTDGEADAILGRLTAARGRAGAIAGKLEEAFADLSRALGHAERRGDVEGEAATLMEFAVLYHLGGDGEHAEQCCLRVLELRDRFESPRLEARVTGNLGGLAHDAGRLEEAYALYVEAIAFAERAKDERLRGVFLGNLAMLDADRGAPDVARSRLHRAIASLGRAGERRLIAITTANLGMVEIELGRPAVGRDHVARAAEVLADVGDDRSLSLALVRRAAASALLGDLQDCELALDEAARRAGRDERTGAVVAVFEAFRHLARGDWARARLARDLAYVPIADGRELASLSDDTRAAIRVLAPRIARP